MVVVASIGVVVLVAPVATISTTVAWSAVAVTSDGLVLLLLVS